MAWHEQGIFLEGETDIFPFKIFSIGGFNDKFAIGIRCSIDCDSRMIEFKNLPQLIALIGICYGTDV